MRLLLDYPWYFILFCLLAGVLYSALLYRRSNHFGSWLRRGLAALRFVTVSLIAFLLLSPMVRMERHESERPIVVVAQDDSRSLALSTDSFYYRSAYLEEMRQLVERLGRRYEVHTFLFSSKAAEAPVELTGYHGEATDMAALFQTVSEQYRHRNLCAVVVASDGRCNQGMSPVEPAQRMLVPVYGVAMGDTTVHRDAAIGFVRFNQRVGLHDRFPVSVTVRADHMAGTRKTLRLMQGGQLLDSREVMIREDYYTATETFLIDAAEAGLQQYTLTLDVDQTEYNPLNNRRTLAVEVVDRHRQIFILASAPHPDVAALRSTLSSSEECDVAVRLLQPADLSAKGLSALKRELTSANLVVLHNLASADLYRELRVLHKPLIHIVGAGADLSQFNALRSGIEVQTKLAKVNEAMAVGRTGFGHFDVSDDLLAAVAQFPPLMSPFGDYRVQPHVQPLFYARIGSVVSEQPLVAVSASEPRQVWVMGDGLWRWRMADYRSGESHERFDLLLDKLATFATAQSEGDRFRIVSQLRYRQGDPVRIEAELYDNNGELTQLPAATLNCHLADGSSEELSQPFSRTVGRRTYYVNLGLLPAGHYRCRATTELEGETLTADGSFVVEDFDLEGVNLVADHTLLRTLAHTTGGAVVPADSVAKIADMLQKRDDIKTVIRSHMRYDELLRLPGLMILLLVLLSAEWLIRKYNGRL